MKSCSKCGCVSTDPKSFVRIGYEQLSKKDKYLCPNCADDYFKGAKNTEQANQPDSGEQPSQVISTFGGRSAAELRYTDNAPSFGTD